MEYAATDHLDHRTLDARDPVVDNTPPNTFISPATGPYGPDTAFTLSATDGGAGVARTEILVDEGVWTEYAGAFSLRAGNHVIGYRSADNLNNTEIERTLSATVEGAPSPAEPNWKPLVAAGFSGILAAAGWWASSGTGDIPRGRRLRRFAGTFLPFVVAEGAKGVVSVFTNLLSIPPILGMGTVVDGSILAAGLTVAYYRARLPQQAHARSRRRSFMAGPRRSLAFAGQRRMESQALPA